MFTNKLLSFSFRGPLDLTRFSGGLPSPSSLLFPYLMNPAGNRNLHHHWAHKGMFKIPMQFIVIAGTVSFNSVSLTFSLFF